MLRKFLYGTNTLAGRLTLVLSIGSIAGCMLAWTGAEYYRDRSLSSYNIDRIVMSVEDIMRRFGRYYVATDADLVQRKILGAILVADGSLTGAVSDADLSSALRSRLPAYSQPAAFKAPAEDCIGHYMVVLQNRAAGFVPIIPDCYLVAVTDIAGKRRVLGLPTPPVASKMPWMARLPFLLLAIAACVACSAIVAQLTLRFMKKLRDATRTFAMDMNADALPENGPIDVVETYRVFNAMQERVRILFAERTNMLAAISHDLQTPLARLRLRAEIHVANPIRSKLLSDISGMERLVQEGIQLAEAHVAIEDWTDVDIGSTLLAVADDAQDAGHAVTLGAIEPWRLSVRPDALLRCLQNLIDNAVQYGGSCHITCSSTADFVEIKLRDEGPGLSPSDLERMFLPFTRGEISRSRREGGTGIGLTIARAQAGTFGASVTLANAADQGLIATIQIPRGHSNAKLLTPIRVETSVEMDC